MQRIRFSPMHRLLVAAMLMAAPAAAMADGKDAAPQRVGTLTCKVVPHSGVSLLIHSTRDILCEFQPEGDAPVEYYKGETGIAFGVDVNIDQHSQLVYAVRARHFRPGSGQLSGKYSGVGGKVTLGLTVGDTAPIGKQDGSISLQPVGGKESGGGVAAGFGYIYLEVDAKRPAKK